MRTVRFGATAVLALLLAGCAGESSAPTPQVATDDDAELLSTALSAGFLDAQGPLGAAMGMGFGAPVAGTGAGMGLMGGMSGMGGTGGGMMGGGMGGGMGAPPTSDGTILLMMPRGMNVTRTITFFDAAGAKQERYDSLTTARVVTDEQVSATNTMTVNGNQRATTMEATHHAEVSGLAGRETSVTLNANGTSKVTMAATRNGKAITTTVAARDVTKDLVVPVPRVRGAFPKSGTVTSERTVSATDGTNRVERAYREVITFDGSASARVTITANGTTKSCTLALDTGRLACGA
jgi:hypothetical protein